MMTIWDFLRVLEDLSYKDWRFLVYDEDGDGCFYVQVEGRCNVTGKSLPWNGRKWRLSRHMTRSEIVQTALKAVLVAEEHEAREKFLYRGRPIFDPHYDVERLWELRGAADALEERK